MIARLLAAIDSFSKREKILFYVCASIFFVAAIVLALYVYFFQTEIRPDHGGIFSEGIVGQPSAINPVVSTFNEVDRDIIELTFASVLDLAQSHEMNETGTRWTVTLKDGLFWSDGEPISSEDIIFTVNLIQNREIASPLASSWKGVNVEDLGDGKIVFVLSSPYSYFQDTLESFMPIPEHIFSKVTASNFRLSRFNLEPVTSGPYKFKGIRQDRDGFISEYILVRNDVYFGPEPFIKEFHFKFFRRFKDAVASFNRKLITGLAGFDSESTSDIKVKHELYELNVPRYYGVFFNLAANDLLKDKKIREALVLATNKNAINEGVFGGYASEINGPILPYIEGYAGELYKNERLNRSGAIALLEEGGWKLNADGVREKDGNLLDFNLIVPQIDFLVESAKLLAQQWLDIGVELQLIILPANDISNEIIKTRDYEMILFGNILRGNSDIFSFWHSSQRFYPGLNLSLYENSVVDNNLETSRSNLDKKKQLDALLVVQREILNDRPADFLFSPPYFYALSTAVKGFSESTLKFSSKRLEDAEFWYLQEKRVLR
ncbi:MAG: ABC transporter substrate-binding protein [bacterium]|nr:ABC transporter substrate-binding protein [bacterium]